MIVDRDSIYMVLEVCLSNEHDLIGYFLANDPPFTLFVC